MAADETDDPASEREGTVQPTAPSSHAGLMNADGAWCWREDCEGKSSLEGLLLARADLRVIYNRMFEPDQSLTKNGRVVADSG